MFSHYRFGSFPSGFLLYCSNMAAVISRAARPMAAPFPGMGLIILQAVGIGLARRGRLSGITTPPYPWACGQQTLAASLRTSRKRVIVATGSTGGSLAMRRKSASV